MKFVLNRTSGSSLWRGNQRISLRCLHLLTTVSVDPIVDSQRSEPLAQPQTLKSDPFVKSSETLCLDQSHTLFADQFAVLVQPLLMDRPHTAMTDQSPFVRHSGLSGSQRIAVPGPFAGQCLHCPEQRLEQNWLVQTASDPGREWS
jgi:hypothetical protein